MLTVSKTMQEIIIIGLMMGITRATVIAQTTQPRWWVGVSGAINGNFYGGTTQRLNNTLIVPTAFNKGHGVSPFGSILMEYRPVGIWGVMLNVGYDGRGADFDGVLAPCDCPATLATRTSYLTVEPSLRVRVASTPFYFFAGPRVAFNVLNSFAYTQLKLPNTVSEFSSMRKQILSGQVGAGYDFLISSPNSTVKFSLSPFVALHPHFGQAPRNIETWSVTTVRAGLALKFGKGAKIPVKEVPPVAVVAVRDVTFTVREPKAVPLKRQISETFPLRNSIFFDDVSSTVPARYVMLSRVQASAFKEEQLLNEVSEDMSGRSARQLNVYHNILNILGDRLRANPGTTISLNGASGKGPTDGRNLAELVKQYLVTEFGIDGSRIATSGRTKPLIPSEHPGGTKDLVLLRAEDRRVDIVSTTPELLKEVGGGMMKPVQIVATQTDPLDGHVVFNVAGAKEALKSWSIDMTDEKGTVQHYGPFTTEQASVPGATVLGNNKEGKYKVVMTGENKNGQLVTKESAVHLVRLDSAPPKGRRYSILFDFDKSNSVSSFGKFLTDVVSPSITDGATVIIHGHTDIIGEENHNMKLSGERARDVRAILESAMAKSGKNKVKFETLGFGRDVSRSPFNNSLPEERFYNRTVIIDIVPVK